MTASTFENPTIPWPLVPLKRVLRFRNGEPFAHVESSHGDYPVYGSGGEFARADDYLHDGTSVLFGRKGTVDKPLLVRGRFWCIDTMFYTRLDPSVDARFVHYFATTIPYTLLATDTARPSMTQTDLGEVKMPFPTLQEQRAIADFLDRETAQIDAMIEAQVTLVALLKERRNALVNSVLNPEDATQRLPLKRTVRYQEGPGIMAVDFRDEGVPLLRVASVKGWYATLEGCNYLDEDMVRLQWERFRVRRNDLLISASASMGTISEVVAEEVVGAIPYTGIIRITPTMMTAPYARWFFTSPDFMRQVVELRTGSTMQHFGPSHLGQMTVALPNRSEQDRRAALLDREAAKADQVIAEATATVALLRERREALITAAVTGRIDPTTGIEWIDSTTEEEAS